MTRQLTPFWTLFLLTGLNLFNYLDRSVLAAVLPSLQKDLGLNDGQAGRAVTAFMLGYFLTSPIFGYLGDRVSRKWLVATGIFVWSLGTLLTGYAASFGILLAYRAMVGLGEASYATISPSLISDTFGPERRNNALTIFYVAIPVGTALGYVLGGQIAASRGWRDAFIWAGAPGLLLALLLLPFEEPRRGQADAPAGPMEKPSVGEVFKLFTVPRYVLVVAGYAAYTFALGAFAVWGPSFLHRVHQVPEKTAASMFGVMAVVAGLLGTLLGGFTATAWQKRSATGYAQLLAGSVLLAVPAAVGAFRFADKNLAAASLALAMFLLFLSTGPVNTVILESVPVKLRASGMALSIFAIHLLGDLWSPEIVGRLSDRWGSLSKAVLILPAALLIAAAFWLVLVVQIRRDTTRTHSAKTTTV